MAADDDLLPGSGLSRVPGAAEDIPADFWDSLIYFGGDEDWDNGHFAYRPRLCVNGVAFDDVQICQPSQPLPPDGEILAKAQSMMNKGLSRDEVAKTLRHEPGFESVTNEHVRRLLLGTNRRGRPRKGPAE